MTGKEKYNFYFDLIYLMSPFIGFGLHCSAVNINCKVQGLPNLCLLYFCWATVSVGSDYLQPAKQGPKIGLGQCVVGPQSG